MTRRVWFGIVGVVVGMIWLAVSLPDTPAEQISGARRSQSFLAALIVMISAVVVMVDVYWLSKRS